MDNIIKISVRNLVEFVSRCGNIDSRYMSAARAQDGIRIHKKIQRMRKKKAALEGSVYESEYTMKHSFAYKECQFVLEGRADGIFAKDGVIGVEEIKSTTKPVEDMEENGQLWHWSQALCYAYIYCLQTSSPRAMLLLTYCNIESEAHISFERILDFGALEAEFFSLVEGYYRFAQLDMARIKERNDTAGLLQFPFEGYRKGQREMAVSVYGAVMKQKRLFAQAPTGTGKTVSAMFPGVKALGEGIAQKLFYITARNTTKKAAESCLLLMEDKGLKLRSVTIMAKEKICPLEKRACNPVDCSRAMGHFDRVNDGILDIIENETQITSGVLMEYAGKHHVCPYEFSLDVTNFSDVIICDYNYVFDPKVRLRRFFGDGEKNEFILLTDEAHNLVDRAREMFSADLMKEEVLAVRRLVGKAAGPLYKALGRINRELLDLGRQFVAGGNTVVMEEAPISFYRALTEFSAAADQWLAENEGAAAHEEMLQFYFRALDFLRIMEIYDARYRTVLYEEGRNVVIKLLCLDPSYQLSLVHGNMKAAVFFSATLTPAEFFRDVLGGNEEDFILKLASPFDIHNLCLLVNNAISTKYRDRERTYGQVAEMVYEAVSPKKGNYMVFFPSYLYLKRVLELFEENHPQVHTVIQKQGGGEEGEKEFLSLFSEENKETLVGFAVMGGVFSEGIDLQGNRLIGAVIVGVGLPLITVERNIIRDYYNDRSGAGYEYAYMYPGMNKVLQAAGRVIRKEDDKGMVLLIDSRFLNSDYLSIFPGEWMGYRRVRDSKSMVTALEDFWAGN